MAEIHNIKKRMPVILHPNDELNWLNNEPTVNFAFPYSVNLIANKENPAPGFQNSLF